MAVPSTSSSNDPPPSEESAHPVDTVPPVVNVPPGPTVTSWPALELGFKVPLVSAALNVKSRSLRSCATSLGFPCRSVSTMSRVPGPVVNVASALTGPPIVELPAGVTKVITDAWTPHVATSNPPRNPHFKLFLRLFMSACSPQRTPRQYAVLRATAVPERYLSVSRDGS